MKKLIPLTLLALTITSCKTQEQIQRDQQINTMSVQMTQNQQLAADVTVKIQTLEEKVQSFQGVLEENTHSRNLKVEEQEKRIKLLEDLTQSLNEQLKDSNKQLTLVENRLKDQDKFIKEILGTLKSQSAKPAKKAKKVKKRSTYEEAMYLYGRGKYKEARVLLEKLETYKKISPKAKARVLHNLGMISFIQKRDQDALTYFSRLFTEYPKSVYNANGLIHMAKTFDRLGQKEQAKQTLNEMISRFPKHRRVKIAQDLLKKI